MLTIILTIAGIMITNGTPIKRFTIRTLDIIQLINGTRGLDGVLKLVLLLQSLIQIHILKVHITITIILDGNTGIIKLTGTE